MITEHPERVSRFLRATLKGWQTAIGDPSGTVDIILKYALLKDRALQTAMFDAIIPLIHTGEGSIGWMHPKRGGRCTGSWSIRNSLNGPCIREQLYTMRFLEDFQEGKPDETQCQVVPAVFPADGDPCVPRRYLSFMNSRKTIKENMVTHLMSTNLLKKAEVERWVQDQALTLEMLSKSPFFKGNFHSMLEVHDETDAGHLAAHHRIEAHLSPAVEEEGKVLELFILRAVDGLVLISTTHNQQGKYLDDKTYFIKGQVGTYRIYIIPCRFSRPL